MTSLAKADLEALLRTRKLDTTLADALPDPVATDPGASVATGVARLDRELGGGFRRGELSEIVGARSSGRLGLLLAAAASATCQGEVVALIDPLDMFDPPSAADGGVDLAGLLWVRGSQISAPSPDSWFRDGRGRGRDTDEAGQPLDRLVERAVKALNLVLQAGGFGLVALDLGEVPPPAVKRLPFTTWLRLERVLEGSRTACVLVGREPIARSAGGATVELRRGLAGAARHGGGGEGDAGGACGTRWLSRRPDRRLFLGFDLEARVIRARARGSGPVPLALASRGGLEPDA